jgi:hypothetical protein
MFAAGVEDIKFDAIADEVSDIQGGASSSRL